MLTHYTYYNRLLKWRNDQFYCLSVQNGRIANVERESIALWIEVLIFLEQSTWFTKTVNFIYIHCVMLNLWKCFPINSWCWCHWKYTLTLSSMTFCFGQQIEGCSNTTIRLFIYISVKEKRCFIEEISR